MSSECADMRPRVATWEVCRAFVGRPAECIQGPPLRTRRLSPPARAGRARAFVCALVAISLLLALAAPLAQAKLAHFYESKITEVPEVGPHGPVPVPGGLGRVNSMTVSSGDVYVAEHLEGEGVASRGDQWAPSAAKPDEWEFVSQLPPQPEPRNGRAEGVALGTAAGEPELFLGQGEFGHPPAVDVFSSGCGLLECASLQAVWTGAEANAPFTSVSAVAVDHSSSPGDWASGDVFVADPESGVVDIFEPQADGKEHEVAQETGLSGAIAVSGFNGDLVVGDKVFRPEEEGPKKGKYAAVCQLVPPGGPLATVRALAVDDSSVQPYAGEIYVLTEGAVYEFGPECTFRDEMTGVPREGAPTGLKGLTEEVAFGFNVAEPNSVAVDPVSHKLFVGVAFGQEGRLFGGAVDVFGPDAVVPDVTTEAPSTPVLATDPTTGAHSWRIEPTGSVNPDEAGEASCVFVWGLTEAFGQQVPCSAPVPEGPSPVHVHATLTGLEPDTAFTYRLQAKNKNGTNKGEPSDDYRFTTPGPGIHSESVSEVSSSGASLEATIAPHDAPTEAHDLQSAAKSPTSYFFQYTEDARGTSICATEPSACASAPEAPASVGSGTEDVQVSQHATGLAAGTTYHYRLVAINEALPETEPGVRTAFNGADHTFTTQGPGGQVVLPDGRAWELVSPADKLGARILPSGQASADGSKFTFLTNSPTEPEPPGAGEHGIQVLSSRVAPGLWSSVDINLSRSEPEGALPNEFHEYRYFSPDLVSAVVESEGPFSIPEGSHLNERGESERIVEAFPVPTERTPYLRHNSTCAATPARCFEPLLDSEDVSSGNTYEGDAAFVLAEANAVAATPDESHVIIDSGVPLLATDPTFALPQRALYEWSAAKPPAQRLALVNVLEGGELGPTRVVALSQDGSRVAFASCGTNNGTVECRSYYVRDMLTGSTARMDLTEGGSPSAEVEKGAFQGASSDLSRMFFTDSAKLTQASGDSDLYVCEPTSETGEPKCAPRDLTPVPAPGHPGAGQDAGVSRVLGVSADGTYVYFVASGVLATGATSGENVYLAHEHEGRWTTTFIASTSGLIDPEVLNPALCRTSECVAAVSPAGRWLAFSTAKPLTGYDNRDKKTGSPDAEVYLYDAATAKLECASCNPSGARPIGPSFVPRWLREPGSSINTSGELLLGPGASHPLFDSGRLFFDSADTLVPQDSNGNLDVYEYEPEGVGSCTASDPTFNPAQGACAGLISSGRASGESQFLEANASASDVFFTTSEHLVGKDTDTSVDVYDAHECASASPCASEASALEECASAAACRPAPVPQPSIFGPPSSATFTGPGNIVPESKPKTAAQIRAERLARASKACKKLRRTRRAACERKARARYGPVRSKRASAKRSPSVSIGRRGR
jgi:hypothetical protein